MASPKVFGKKIQHFLWILAHEYLFDLTWFVGPPLIALFADFKIEGPGRIPKKGGVLITFNHLSQWDLVVIYNILPRSFNTMAKTEFFEVFFLGGLVRLLGAFPVKRGKIDRQALRHSIDLLNQGKLLGIFPEGHRSDNFALMKAHKGAALIACQANPLIVPVAIYGTELISRQKEWRKTRPGPFFLNRPRVRVHIGEPYKLPEPVPGQRQDLDQLTALIMGKIAELLPPPYRGVYAGEKLPEHLQIPDWKLNYGKTS